VSFIRYNGAVTNSSDKNTSSSRFKLVAFTAIGIFNTLLDIVIYIFVLNSSHNIIIANIVATSIALIGSYLLNSKITFQAKTWTKTTFISFVLVTVFGLWILQTATIYGLDHLVNLVPSHIWHMLGGLEKTGKQVIPKLLATAVTLVWNYLWYNKVIFKGYREEANRLALTDL
jgi:putative flippase GtrA